MALLFGFRVQRFTTMIGLVALTMAIMIVLPLVTKKIPAALSAIVHGVTGSDFGNLETETVRSFIQSKWRRRNPSRPA